MRLVNPLGKEKMATVVDFNGIGDEPMGCACSFYNGQWLTMVARVGHLEIGNCKCQCSYGNENGIANLQIGFNSNDYPMI